MEIGTRVEIPTWFDAWMQGDRYGEITKITKPHRQAWRDQAAISRASVASVKLDKSGRTMRVQVSLLREV